MTPHVHIFKIPAGVRLSVSTLMWVWFAFAKGLQPEAATWIEVLLMFSILILMPLTRQLGDVRLRNPSRETTEFLTGILLVQALLKPIPSLLGSVMCGLWLVQQLMEVAWLLRHRQAWLVRDAALGCQVAARLFPSIGAAWLLAHRLNWMPFGFDALIVLLTAAHFHHAGFTLPLMAGLGGKALPGPLSQHSCGLILTGVPLVAIGITCTHFQVLPWVEPISVSVLVAGALGTAVLQIQMAFHNGNSWWSKGLFFISGLSLFIAMLLALGFGLRSVLPHWALPMPSMWAVHGTLNTFGFGLCGILAWRSRNLK